MSTTLRESQRSIPLLRLFLPLRSAWREEPLIILPGEGSNSTPSAKPSLVKPVPSLPSSPPRSRSLGLCSTPLFCISLSYKMVTQVCLLWLILSSCFSYPSYPPLHFEMCSGPALRTCHSSPSTIDLPLAHCFKHHRNINTCSQVQTPIPAVHLTLPHDWDMDSHMKMTGRRRGGTMVTFL